MRDPARLFLALTVLGCGPSPSVDASGTQGGSTTSSGTGTSAADASSESVTTVVPSSTTETTTGTSGAPDCAENDAVPPLCYRLHPIEWDGHPGSWDGRTRVGRFGPEGEVAYLLSGGDVGEPMGLAAWNGAGFDVREWGVVPQSEDSSRVAIRMFSQDRSDLLLLDYDSQLRIARWGPDGPGEEVVAQPSVMGLSGVTRQPIFDLDGDGLEEFVGQVYENKNLVHRIVENVDGIPTYSTVLVPTLCDSATLALNVGDFDADGMADVASLGPCEVTEKAGVFSFSVFWGSPAGEYQETLIEFAAESPTGWLGVGDFDGDTVDDIAIASWGVGDFEMYVDVQRSNGDRSFALPTRAWRETQPPHSYEPPFESAIAYDRHFAVDDVDGDGADDLVFVASMYALVDLLDDPESLPLLPTWATGDDEAIPAADLNGDGRLDFILYRDSGLIEGLLSAD